MNDEATLSWNRRVRILGGVSLAAIFLAASAGAQTKPSENNANEQNLAPETYQTFYLTHATQGRAANEIVNDLRNMAPKAKVYYVPSEYAISMRASAEDLATAERILRDVDRPKEVYRLTYTITESDGGKKIGTDRAALVVAAEGQTVLKQGSRVPIVTGKSDEGTSAQNSQVQYLDVGLTIEASLDGTRLQTKIEQTSLGTDKSGLGALDPVVLQNKLETVSTLTPGKALVLGSFDVPGSTRHKDVEVLAEVVQ